MNIEKEFVEDAKKLLTMSLIELADLASLATQALHQKAILEGKSYEHSYELFHDQLGNLIIYCQKQHSKELLEIVEKLVDNNITYTLI